MACRYGIEHCLIFLDNAQTNWEGIDFETKLYSFHG